MNKEEGCHTEAKVFGQTKSSICLRLTSSENFNSDMQITARKNEEQVSNNNLDTLKDEKVITVVFGDQLKKIMNYIHEISPFSSNALDD